MFLLVAAVFLAILCLGFFSGKAYADNQPQTLTPGDDGGGHYNPWQHTVEGWISPFSGTQNTAGLRIFLSVNYGWSYSATADEEGHFEFTAYDIYPNYDCFLCINGGGDGCYLGQQCIDRHWGQWSAVVHTDSIGYYCSDIFLEPAATVNVTAAALFSNTQYATLEYGTEAHQGVTHALSFHSPTIGISTGFTTTMDVVYSSSFAAQPGYSQYIYHPYYAPTYKSEYDHSLASGIGEYVDNTDWGSASTHEYIDKRNPPTMDYVDFSVAPGSKECEYRETGSWTWSLSAHIPFGIVYRAFGELISLDATVAVTSGHTTWVKYTINNTSGHDLWFRVYTAGAMPNQGTQTGGLELHVWLKDW